MRKMIYTMMPFSFIIALLYCQSVLSFGERDADLKAGSEKYHAILKESSLPRYGECWKNALHELNIVCKELTDMKQHRLALLFANCFLLSTGRKQHLCPPDIELSECTKDMPIEAFITYNEHFTHTQNLCFFLESQIWQEKADQTARQLVTSSEEAVVKIDNSNRLQNEVIEKQTLALINQEQFLDQSNQLRELLRESSGSVKKILVDFKESTHEQRDMLFEVFDKLSGLQSLVLGEFTGFYSLVYYTLSVVVCYLLTSTQRTIGSRFWLFVIMTVNVICERIIVFFTSSDKTLFHDENTLIYTRLWWCRKTFTGIAVVVWAYFAYTFQDINKINNNLLEQIRKQNSDLKKLLECSRRDVSQSACNENSQAKNYQSNRDKSMNDVENCTTGYETESSVSSDSSYNSRATDKTYQYPANISDSESCSSFQTTTSIQNRMSRESTPALREELRDIRNCTPIREMTPIRGVTVADVSFDTSVNDSLFLADSSDTTMSSVKRSVGRPKGVGRRSAPVLSVPKVQYNLRSRKRASLPPVSENPQVTTESTQEFCKIVRHLSGVTRRNTTKVNVTLGRLNTTTNK